MHYALKGARLSDFSLPFLSPVTPLYFLNITTPQLLQSLSQLASSSGGGGSSSGGSTGGAGGATGGGGGSGGGAKVKVRLLGACDRSSLFLLTERPFFCSVTLTSSRTSCHLLPRSASLLSGGTFSCKERKAWRRSFLFKRVACTMQPALIAC